MQVDLVKDYWNDVFEPLVAGYERGLTPSPDIVCNRNIKFGVFHDFCTERLGCDLVRIISDENKSYEICKGCRGS